MYVDIPGPAWTKTFGSRFPFILKLKSDINGVISVDPKINLDGNVFILVWISPANVLN
jgi:hypothetical protein